MEVEVRLRVSDDPGQPVALGRHGGQAGLVGADQGELSGHEEAVGADQQHDRQQSPDHLKRGHAAMGELTDNKRP